MRAWLLILGTAVALSCQNDVDPADLSNLSNSDSLASENLTSIQWIDSVKNLGKINEGQKVEIGFRFKNTGNHPLIIQSVNPSCGCTVADYPKKPIAPGEEGEITGSFDSKGREGMQQKEMTVFANTVGSTRHVVQFQVEVLKQKS